MVQKKNISGTNLKSISLFIIPIFSSRTWQQHPKFDRVVFNVRKLLYPILLKKSNLFANFNINKNLFLYVADFKDRPLKNIWSYSLVSFSFRNANGMGTVKWQKMECFTSIEEELLWLKQFVVQFWIPFIRHNPCVIQYWPVSQILWKMLRRPICLLHKSASYCLEQPFLSP